MFETKKSKERQEVIKNLNVLHQRLMAVEEAFNATLAALLSKGVVTSEDINEELWRADAQAQEGEPDES